MAFGVMPMFAYMAYVAMPSWSVLLMPARGVGWLSVLLFLAMVARCCGWLGGVTPTSPLNNSHLNKFGVRPASAQEDWGISGSVLAISVMGRPGDVGIDLDLPDLEARGGNLLAASRWSSSMAAVSCCSMGGAASGSSSSMEFSLSTLQAERQPLPPWLLALDGRLKVFFNLQYWRPLCAGMVGSRCGGPSGQFPGVAAVDHRWIRELGGDGAGPDRFLRFRSEVLGANWQDLFVNFYFLWVLCVSCNSTAQN